MGGKAGGGPGQGEGVPTGRVMGWGRAEAIECCRDGLCHQTSAYIHSRLATILRQSGFLTTWRTYMHIEASFHIFH